MLQEAGLVAGKCRAPNSTYIIQSPAYFYTEITMRPVWLALCTIGNIFNILLLRQIRTFQSVFLVSIAVLDLSVMWFWFAEFVRERFPEEPSPNHPTEALLVACYFLAEAAALSSHWTLAVFCATCLACLLNPFRFQLLLTRRRMRIVIMSIVLCSVPLTIYRVFSFAARDDVHAAETWLGQWREVQTVVALLVNALPCCAMIGLNLAVVIVLCKRRWRTKAEEGYDIGVPNARVFALHVHQTKGLAVSWHSKDSLVSSAMRLLTANVVIWCVFAAVFWIARILHLLHDACRVQLSDHQFLLLHIVSVQCQYAYYSLNFLVYCSVCRVYFRRCVRLVWRCAECFPGKKATMKKEPSTQDTIFT